MKASLQGVLKMSWRRLQNAWKISWRRFCRRLENVFKTSWKIFGKASWRSLEDVEDFFKTSWRHLEDVLKMFLQDVLKTYGQDKYIGLDQDVLKTSSEDKWLRRIYYSWSRPLENVFDIFWGSWVSFGLLTWLRSYRLWYFRRFSELTVMSEKRLELSPKWRTFWDLFFHQWFDCWKLFAIL